MSQIEHDRFLDLLFARSQRANVTIVLIALNALAFVASAGMAGQPDAGR